jgi:DivIVA domain-containing protein
MNKDKITSQDIETQLFSTTRFKEGYDMDEVDDFLEHIIETMYSYETLLRYNNKENSKIKRLEKQLKYARERVEKLESEKKVYKNIAKRKFVKNE